MRSNASPPQPPRRTGSSRERVDKLRAARRRGVAPLSMPSVRLWALAGVAVLALLALAPSLMRVYTPGASRASFAASTAAATTPIPAATATPARALYAGPTAVPGSTTRVPILMYHYIRTVDSAADPSGYALSVTPESFGAQLDWLAKEGYTSLRMDEALACMRGAVGCPPKPVVLTFDDGYDDAYTAALPLLRAHGMVGTFYIVGQFVGQKGYMGTDKLIELHKAGMELGAHSMRHLDLTSFGRDEALREIQGSKDLVEAVIKVPISSFCYPAGRYNAETRALVAEAGFTNAVTTDAPGAFDDALLLPRLRVEGATSLDSFATMVRSVSP